MLAQWRLLQHGKPGFWSSNDKGLHAYRIRWSSLHPISIWPELVRLQDRVTVGSE